MANMSYCRHENTLHDLEDVIKQWDDFDESQYSDDDPELVARRKLEELINWDKV